MNPDLESFDDLIIAHDEDPWNALAHNSVELYEDYTSRSPSSAATSVGSISAAVLSSREPSIATKPTSYATDYPIHNQQQEGKASITYAASLSATHGSGSEADAEHDDLLHADLVGTGAWSSDHRSQESCLRKRENARPRLSETLPHRRKKPCVIIHQYNRNAGSLPQNTTPLFVTEGTSTGQGTHSAAHDIFFTV